MYMKYLDYYIYLILIVKILYFSTAAMEEFEKNEIKKKDIEDINKKLLILFYFLMALLLMYLFHPFTKDVVVRGHEKLFIFILGLLMAIDIVRRYIRLHS